MMRIVAASLALSCLCGCYVNTYHYGTPIPPEHLSEIVDGRTGRAQVVQSFGPPSAFYRPELLDLALGRAKDAEAIPSRVDDDIFTYQYVTTKVRAFFLPLLFITFRSQSVSDTLVVFFDERGTVSTMHSGMTRASFMTRSEATLAALLLLLSTACSKTLVEVTTERRDVAFRTDQASDVESLTAGEGATKASVLSALGPPLTVIPQERGDVFVYRREAYDSQTVNVNPSWFTSVPTTSIYTNTDQSRRDDVLMIFFDAAGRARSFAASRGTLDTSGSRAARVGEAFEGLRK
ncbi:MAG: hypothetical protein U1E76_02710 [Planctomycetota bacterium]